MKWSSGLEANFKKNIHFSSTPFASCTASEMSLLSPPSLHSSLAVLVLNRCIHSVKSSLEGLPAAYWFIINEIRTFVCQGGFCPIVGWIFACQEDLLYNRRGHWRNKEEQRTDMVVHCQGHCDFYRQTLKKDVQTSGSHLSQAVSNNTRPVVHLSLFIGLIDR